MVICIVRRLEHSKMGYCLLAVRENESAAEALGVNITKTKMVALVISGCITAVCGVVYAQYVWYIEPGSVFSNAFSVQITLTAIIGGLTTVWGPIVGAVFLIPLGEILRVYLGGGGHGIYLMIYGVLLIAVVRLLPKGILSVLDRSNDNTGARGGS
jgi:branched-chain amino acid transport system permease protein